MPTYEYRCAKCGEHVEVFQTFSEEPLKKHAGCGGKLTKVLSSVGIVLKGSGFYKTDSRESNRKRSGRREETAASSSTSDTSPSKSDTKSDSTATKKSDPAAPAASSASSEKKPSAKSA